MEQNSLKIILTRFKRSDYPYLVTNWGPLSTDFDVDVQKISKSEFVTAVAKKLKVFGLLHIEILETFLIRHQNINKT